MSKHSRAPCFVLEWLDDKGRARWEFKQDYRKRDKALRQQPGRERGGHWVPRPRKERTEPWDSAQSGVISLHGFLKGAVMGQYLFIYLKTLYLG